MTNRPMLAAYWLPSVGIGAAEGPPPVLPGDQTVIVPLLDLLNYRRSDGSLQIDVINLFGCRFNTPDKFPQQYLVFDDNLKRVLTDGTVARLQQAGMKVVLTIVGFDYKTVGWSSIPTALIGPFVGYLNQEMLDVGGFNLDGIDIDDEYSIRGENLVETVQTMYRRFPSDKIISKALFDDLAVIPDIAGYLTFGGIMNYGDSAPNLQAIFWKYVEKGMRPDQLTIGVNAGPVAQSRGNFTSIETARTLAQWQPAGGGLKLGMMVWSFSQDIQQFTAYPQNQVALAFPNVADHAWQRAIIEVMEAEQGPCASAAVPPAAT